MEQQQLSGSRAAAVAELYRAFVRDPQSVDPAWRDFFGDLDQDARALLDDFERGRVPAAPGGEEAARGGNGTAAVAAGLAPGRDITAADIRAATLDSIRALMLIRAYRVRGHLEAIHSA